VFQFGCRDCRSDSDNGLRRLDRLVYFERFQDVHNAIEREKRIKGWLRSKKIAPIVSVNPEWRDLSVEWYERHQFQPEAAPRPA
jgi:predicted GIY-YIG superfamily endonuclease